jgi:hypothetical protein
MYVLEQIHVNLGSLEASDPIVAQSTPLLPSPHYISTGPFSHSYGNAKPP